MSTPDSGGFDVVINVTSAAATRGIGATMAGLSGAFQVMQPMFQGAATVNAALRGVSFAPGNVISAAISIAGSQLVVTQVDPSLLPPGTTLPTGQLAVIELGGTITVTDIVQVAGTSVIVDFRPDAAGNPLVDVGLDVDKLLSAPIVQSILAYFLISQGEDAFLGARDLLIDTIRNAIGDAIRSQLAAAPPITLATAPVLPGPCPPPVSALAVATTATEIRMLLTLGGTPGTPAAITRNSLLIQPSTGIPLDAASIVISNRALLRDLIRCALIASGGFPAGGFLAAEPCFFVGPTRLTVPGVGPVSVSNLIAGIDEAGLLRVSLAFRYDDPVAGAFTISGSVSQGFGLTPSPPTVSPSLTIGPAGPPSVSSRVDIAGWVYAAAFFTGGFGVTWTIAAADAIADLFASGAVSGMIGGLLPPAVTVPVALPAGTPATAIRAVTSTQADATPHVVTLAGGFVFTNPFRDHDVIINLI